MSAAHFARTRTFTAEFRGGLRATLTISMSAVNCEWDPDLPGNVLPPAEREASMAAYRTWRNECLTEFARAQGLVLKVFTLAGVDALALCEPEPAAGWA